ncbi:hypothetical protein LIER_40602 [Lithospermum erythrorhizon]|uniref:Uncharacterized protein n=1 Tax=Lithospermum erythrorhizon TaxID=34254 RepID=A0AAV3QYF6_LITER
MLLVCLTSQISVIKQIQLKLQIPRRLNGPQIHQNSSANLICIFVKIKDFEASLCKGNWNSEASAKNRDLILNHSRFFEGQIVVLAGEQRRRNMDDAVNQDLEDAVLDLIPKKRDNSISNLNLSSSLHYNIMTCSNFVNKCLTSLFKNGKRILVVVHNNPNDIMKILSWNCRGLGQTSTVQFLVTLIKRNINVFPILLT